MMEDKKQSMSVRVNTSDLLKTKQIASRLGIKESDLFRFALKSILAKLSPLEDRESKGVALLPALIECGQELSNYFGMDTRQLDKIINGGVQSSSEMVDPKDIELLTWSPFEGSYRRIRLATVSKQLNTNDPEGSLKTYLVEKYFPKADALAS